MVGTINGSRRRVPDADRDSYAGPDNSYAHDIERGASFDAVTLEL